MSSPGVTLPRVIRVIGLIATRLFSFTGVIEGMQVNPIWTSRVMQRL